ncbi:unnamed protein product [Heligmosomoides polygyrus]|uniref:Transmembrane 9 superfamily member n=1 Tax=Heligmosomoides polygyrus TaxID=6339 RepID=A0A183FRU0_HELPZ|nr:unnamed protein product [Heligmosomoides polygyrus]
MYSTCAIAMFFLTEYMASFNFANKPKWVYIREAHKHTRKEYEVAHPHSPIPVLLNDVFFAVHALFACLLTVLQCLIYYRGSQRVSNTCYAISAFMILAGVGAGAVTFFGYLNMLQFVTSLSYIKMAVTLLKYIPQV